MLDPNEAATTIAQAVGAGAISGITASIKDSIAALCRKIKARFGDDEDAKADLNIHSRHPDDQTQERLAQHISAYGADSDSEITDQAKEILDHLEISAIGSGAMSAGNITQNFSGSGNAYMGGSHTINNTYSDQPSSENVPKWEVRHHKGSTYELENIGAGTAYSVEVECPGSVRFDPPEVQDGVWPGGESHRFFASSAWGSEAKHLLIHYRTAPGGDTKTLKCVLPPKRD